MLDTIAPYFGYLASLLLIIALLVNNDLKFRWFNSLGNISFITYAIVFSAYPVLLTNCILLCINGYYLIKIYYKQENFDLFQFAGDEKLVQKFVEYFQKDIQAYYPDFKHEQLQAKFNFAVTRDLVIANIFSVDILENGDAYVLINYTTKKYRDFKVGTFIFEKEHDFLVSKGVKRIIYKDVFNKHHLEFITVMGFKMETINGENMHVKNL